MLWWIEKKKECAGRQLPRSDKTNQEKKKSVSGAAGLADGTILTAPGWGKGAPFRPVVRGRKRGRGGGGGVENGGRGKKEKRR